MRWRLASVPAQLQDASSARKLRCDDNSDTGPSDQVRVIAEPEPRRAVSDLQQSLGPLEKREDKPASNATIIERQDALWQLRLETLRQTGRVIRVKVEGHDRLASAGVRCRTRVRMTGGLPSLLEPLRGRRQRDCLLTRQRQR